MICTKPWKFGRCLYAVRTHGLCFSPERNENHHLITKWKNYDCVRLDISMAATTMTTPSRNDYVRRRKPIEWHENGDGGVDDVFRGPRGTSPRLTMPEMLVTLI